MHVTFVWAHDVTCASSCVHSNWKAMDSLEDATKIKEAIDLLSAALGESTRNNWGESCSNSSGHSSQSLTSSSSSGQSALAVTVVNCSSQSHAVTACSNAINALAHLRQMRAAEQKGNFELYHRGSMGSGSKKQAEVITVTPSKMSKSHWSHKFVCLGSTMANKTPSSTEKALLSSVALGKKVIKFRSHQTMLQ